MRKKMLIITFIIILIIQAIMPINVNAASTVFSENIRFQWKDSGNGYGVCIPSNASEYQNIPVIVWLHGLGECGKGRKWCKNSTDFRQQF